MGFRSLREMKEIREREEREAPIKDAFLKAIENYPNWYWYPNHGPSVCCNYIHSNNAIATIHYSRGKYLAEYRTKLNQFPIPFTGKFDNPATAVKTVEEFHAKTIAK